MLSSQAFYKKDVPWSDADHVKLAELWHGGMCLRAIATQLGRSLNSTTSRIDATVDHKRNDAAGSRMYTLEERDLARRKYHEEGMLPKDIAKYLGWPVRSVQTMLSSMQSHNPPTWEQVKRLFSLKEAGVSWAEIGNDLGTERTVRYWIRIFEKYMAARKPPGSHSWAKWTDKEQHEVLRLRNIMRLSYPEIANRLPGRSYHSVRKMYELLDGSVKTVRANYYSAQERDTIVRLHAAKRPWNEIAMQLPGRSVSGIKKLYVWTLRGRYTMDQAGNVQWHDPRQDKIQ
ncbi:Putative Homeobox-like domain superfamily protein [Septoria linicola]|uniref:Homeobox-like domain superfamily protein n=1 Tax=Septoria linicola TaxID=215465 RepID=A0A9Q9AX30_9PEZI|nr:putative Homeobox-like domain superfamily protein [Septoria linicola]USW52241.1 Putative Homeobox-like domain superfamily protein [Septoria linicola]